MQPLYDIKVKGEKATYVMSNVAKPKKGGILSVDVDLSLETGANKAAIALPYLKGLDLDTIVPGDEVTIRLGSSLEVLKTAFVGYVDEVSPQLPVILKCVDAWRELKNAVNNTTYKNVAAAGVINDIVKELAGAAGLTVVTGDTPLTTKIKRWPLENVSSAKALAHLAEKTGTTAYIVPGTNILYFGYPYEYWLERQDVTPVFGYGENIAALGDLRFLEKKAIGQVVVYGVDPSYKKHTVVGRYPAAAGEGPIITEEIETTEEADAQAEAELRYTRLTDSHYEGGFTAVGRVLFPGQKILMRDKDQGAARNFHAIAETVNLRWGNTAFTDITVLKSAN